MRWRKLIQTNKQTNKPPLFTPRVVLWVTSSSKQSKEHKKKAQKQKLVWLSQELEQVKKQRHKE